MNKAHATTISAASIATAAVGILVWILTLCKVTVPDDVVGETIVLLTAIIAKKFHQETGVPNDTSQPTPPDSNSANGNGNDVSLQQPSVATNAATSAGGS